VDKWFAQTQVSLPLVAYMGIGEGKDKSILPMFDPRPNPCRPFSWPQDALFC